MGFRHVALGLAGLAVVSACSAALNWNQDGLPCEYDASTGKYSCLQGYTCALRNLDDPNDNLCIANYSLGANSNCQKDIQCAKGYTCPSGVCLATCDPNDSYLQGNCGLGSYCKPYYTTSAYIGSGTAEVTLEGACQLSDQCTVGQLCDPDGGSASSGSCLAVSSAATACVLGCDVYFQAPTTATSYMEQCSPRGSYQSSCQAVGPVDNQVTACVTDYPAALPGGSACENSVAQPCVSGYTCWEGLCAAWCPVTDSPTSACPNNGQYCCSTTLTSSQNITLGYCVDGDESNCSAN